MTSMHAEAQMNRKLVLFAQQLEGYLAHFPSCHKYTLTQSIRQAFLDVYNLVTEAQKRFHKKTTLTQLDVKHEQLRMMIHLANELGLFHHQGGRRDARAGRVDGVVSRLGHARRTASFAGLVRWVEAAAPDVHSQLPRSFLRGQPGGVA